MLALLLSLTPSLLTPALLPSGPAVAADVVAIQAGTIHVVEDDRVVENGTLLVEDGRVVAVGADLEIPPHARIVDYGPGAVIVPGLVAADSNIGGPQPSDRTADPGVLAIDNFDPYASHVLTLAGGVTSAYLAPARGRLIGGQGAVVKLAGDETPRRVLSSSTGLHGSIGAEARRTPGYWEPPVPATVDVGLGVEDPQLPRTTMGAVVALRELLALARGESDSEAYGRATGAKLRELIEARRPWRMGAETPGEVRALLEFFGASGLPLVIEGASQAAGLADEIAATGYTVIVEPLAVTNRAGVDRGKDPETAWPSYDTAAALADAGVPVVIAAPEELGTRDLLFAARLASRGGLPAATALRAITLEAARVLGVADRVGSLAPGKDADFVVLSGPPLDLSSRVVETWVDGEAAWKPQGDGGAVVISVEELHVGDGEVLRPGEVLVVDGRISEVGRRVARPMGAKIVRGPAAMPGVIDALGHLGLEGSNKTPRMDFELARILAPGDELDRRVARHGVTTIALTSRGQSAEGVRITPYKPAAQDVDSLVVADPAGVRLAWTHANRLESGESVRKHLEKAKEYVQKWAEYDKELAAWEAKKAAEAAKPAPESAEEEADEEGDEEKADEDGDDDKKKGKKKDEEPLPVTGVWHATVTDPAESVEVPFKLRLLDEDGAITGSLRSTAVTEGLIDVSGEREQLEVKLEGRGSRGLVTIEATSDNEGKLSGKATVGDTTVEFTAEQVSKEYLVARRPEPVEKETEAEDKDKPRSPGLDPALEPLRRAMRGDAAVVVEVDREDEILACVAAFEGHGIRPVLLGANDAWRIADRLEGRIAGVLLDHRIVYTDAKMGARVRNRYAELQAMGIPVAFHSGAEEGAIDVPMMAAYAVSQGMSPVGALRALTADAAAMLTIEDRVGRLSAGLDGDVLLLDGPPLDPATSILGVWVDGREVGGGTGTAAH